MLSCSGLGCSGFKVGDTLSGRRWSVALSGSTIDLYNVDDDMAFRGTMDGRRFVATYPVMPWEYPDHARIEGEFGLDGNWFDAVETYFYGTPDGARADWQWRVSRVR